MVVGTHTRGKMAMNDLISESCLGVVAYLNQFSPDVTFHLKKGDSRAVDSDMNIIGLELD